MSNTKKTILDEMDRLWVIGVNLATQCLQTDVACANDMLAGLRRTDANHTIIYAAEKTIEAYIFACEARHPDVWRCAYCDSSRHEPVSLPGEAYK